MRSAWAMLDGLVAQLAELETATPARSPIVQRAVGDARHALGAAVAALSARRPSSPSRHDTLEALAAARLAVATARELTSALEGGIARAQANLVRAQVLVARSLFARGLLPAGLHVFADDALLERSAVETQARALLAGRPESELWLVAVTKRRGRAAVSVHGPHEWTAQRLKVAVRRVVSPPSALSGPG
ncbi:MAG TPA: hypothetical protein VGL15_01440 [Vicinamibacteria bacterium]|jgi:hypothetical protein